MFAPEKIRGDFPILSQTVNGRPLVYLDNAATTQLPLCVLESIREHYCTNNANVHRGIHALSERSTSAFEEAREKVKTYLNAGGDRDVVFTQGTTDSINLVAAGLRNSLGSGDSIVVTELEHHSNFVPWQRLCRDSGASFVVVPCPEGRLDEAAYEAALARKPRLVAAAQVSNLTGTVLPLEDMIRKAHRAGALFLVDGAQGARHENTDLAALDCDFYCFSGHKLMAPTGIGVLCGKRDALEELEPSRFGGGMVGTVTPAFTDHGPLPSRLEAGTPNYVGAIALGRALDYLTELGREDIAAWEQELTRYAEEGLCRVPEVQILGRPERRAGVISFLPGEVHPYDAASFLDKFGVAMRSGTHCAQPALRSFGVESALRLSVAFYNTKAEIDFACEALEKTIGMVRKWRKT